MASPDALTWRLAWPRPSFLAALSLDEMAASGTYEPPAASDASSQSEGSTSRRAVG